MRHTKTTNTFTVYKKTDTVESTWTCLITFLQKIQKISYIAASTTGYDELKIPLWKKFISAPASQLPTHGFLDSVTVLLILAPLDFSRF